MPCCWGVPPVLALAWGLCQSHGTLDLYFWTKWCFWDAESEDTYMVKTSPTTMWQRVPVVWLQLWTHISDKGQTPTSPSHPRPRPPSDVVRTLVCVRSSGARMGPWDTHHIPEGGAQLSPEWEPSGGIRKGRHSSGGPQLPLWERDSSLPCVTLLRPGWRGNPRNPTHSDTWRCAQS